MSSRKKDWVMNQAAFDRLLAQFDPDPKRAGAQYEVTRQGLIRFFECRGGISPPDRADETINRVAYKLMEGEEIKPGVLAAYFYGVARNVLREHRRSREAQSAPLDELPPHQQPMVNPHTMMHHHQAQFTKEQQMACLEKCVAALPPETRGLILAYYEGEEGVKIKNRKRLAEVFEISLSRLRLRIHRIREKLETCVTGCLKQAGE